MELNNKTNPLEIPEILKHILGYVGSNNHHTDLLGARGVSRLWNALVMELLPEPLQVVQLPLFYGRSSVLQEEEVVNALSSTLTRTILGLQCSLAIGNKEDLGAALPLSELTRIHTSWLTYVILGLAPPPPIPPPSSRSPFGSLPPITSILFHSPMSFQHLTFWELMNATSTTLREIYINCIFTPPVQDDKRPSGQVEHLEENLFITETIGSKSYSYPALKTLTYLAQPDDSVPPYDFGELINSAPQLNSLVLGDQNNSSTTPPSQIKKRGFDHLLASISASTKRFSSFECKIYDQTSVRAIYVHCRFRALTSLRISQCRNYHLHPGLLRLLARRCPRLTEFGIHFLDPARIHHHVPLDLLNLDVFEIEGLPVIPNITKLSLTLDPVTIYRSKNLLNNLLICTKVFPNVRSLETELSTCIKLSQPNLFSHVNWELFKIASFSSLVTLTIKTGPSKNLLEEEVFTSRMKGLVPNLTKLILVHDVKTSPEFSRNGLLAALLNLNGIKELEVIGSSHADILEEIFKATSSSTKIRQSLEYLKIGQNKFSKVATNIYPYQYLNTICKTFDGGTLKVIEIDEEILRNPGGSTTTSTTTGSRRRLSYEQLQNPLKLIRQEYPEVKIILHN